MSAQVRRLPFNDEEIGMGVNSESGLAVGTALDNFTVQEESTASGQEVSAAIKIINSHEELMDSLDLSFEAQGRYGFYSASAKAAFAESSHYNSTSTFLVARCIVQNPFRRGRNWRVQPTAQALLDAVRFDEFKTAFGDSFVRGLQTGGEFYSVIRITSVSSTTQSELSAALEAEMNGLVAAGSFKGQFQQANSSSNTRSEFSSTLFQRAGSGAQSAVVIDIGEVLARYKNFPDIAQTSAFAYETEVATYDTLPLPIPTPEEQADFLLALRDAREKKLRYIQVRNDLEFALQHPEFFQALPAPEVLLSAAAGYTKLLNAVIDYAVKLSRGLITPPQVFDPSQVVPALAAPAPIPLQRVVVLTPPTTPAPQLVAIDPSLDDVLLGGPWRSAAELSLMSEEDKRNTLIVELSKHTSQSVAHFQGLPTDALVGSGAIAVFLQQAGIRSLADMLAMTDDDQRNTLIVENNLHTSISIPELQAMDSQKLVQVGNTWFGKPVAA
ncbi:hypothetical protein HHL22_09570 [Hymenobacter sp. RP-2-7]|uniref:MACPF domain-containing protein n=1 Tax=Hymenobacter polaris TaxID=2682546 RepID=A0A7Y0ADS0_9BACT|nr:hypothetical protein [Hymenobacter polaris]NML65452.1 hypothetical protein [Hymenobacter polaris]